MTGLQPPHAAEHLAIFIPTLFQPFGLILCKRLDPLSACCIPTEVHTMKITMPALALGILITQGAMAAGDGTAALGGGVGGALGNIVGQQLGGSTGAAVGAGVGGAAGSAVGAERGKKTEAAIGGGLGSAGGSLIGNRLGGTTGSTIGAGVGGAAGGALGNNLADDGDNRKSSGKHSKGNKHKHKNKHR